MIEPRYVTVTVAEHERCEEGPFYFGDLLEDGSLDRVIASLVAIRESIPEDFRALARCEIGSYASYECSSPTIEVTYKRAETEEEAQARISRQMKRAADAVARARQAEAEARAIYAGIKAEIEPAQAENAGAQRLRNAQRD